MSKILFSTGENTKRYIRNEPNNLVCIIYNILEFSFFNIKNIRVYLLLILLLVYAVSTYPQSININKTDSSGAYSESRNFDIRLFRSINNYRSGFLDGAVTITDNSMLPASLIIPTAMFLMGRAFDNTYDENTGVLLGTSEVLNLGLTYGIKFLVRRDRPYKTLSRVHHKDVSISDPYSFPSGHSSTTFAISTMFALRYPKQPQIYVPLYLWSVIVGYGRVYFGMHYPSDVLAGAVVGALSSVTVYSLRNHILNFKNQVLGGRDRPDKNYLTAETMGIAAGSYLVLTALNEFIFSGKSSFDFSISPSMISNNQTELKLTLKLH